MEENNGKKFNSAKEIIDYIKNSTSNSEDMVYKELELGKETVNIVYSEATSDGNFIADFIIRSLRYLFNENINEKIQLSYKKNLANILMSVRHYICVDEPKELLTHKKISTYILKPLMFALRQERFCATGVYPLTIESLLESYQDDNRIMVEYFLNEERFETDILSNHKDVLMFLHNKIQNFLENDL